MSSEIKQIIGLVEGSSLEAVQASPTAATGKGVVKRKKLGTYIAPVTSSSDIDIFPS